MAKRIITELIDDIDGSPNAKTVPFSFDGVNYEIELAEDNRKAFREALDLYIAKGRKASDSGASKRRRSSSPSQFSKDELQAIRVWARANGHSVSDRGRIAASIVAAYQAAN